MANPVDVYVGSRLRMRRTMLGLSQNKIGEMIGVTFQQIQKYEKGINRMGSSRLYQFARILLVPISYFFDGYENLDDKNGPLTKVAEGESLFREEDLNNKEIAHLIKHFIKISDPTVRKSVISLAKSLALKNEDN
jgi:transcriptional regulator with XRE-family HTH domain